MISNFSRRISIKVSGYLADLNFIVNIIGTLLVYGFAGYTFGSIMVYFLTTNYKSKERSSIFMAILTMGLAVVVLFIFKIENIPIYYVILWNVAFFILAAIFGYIWATRGIMNLNFDSQLPEGLPIESDEDCSAVIILTDGESEEYSPLPIIRRFKEEKATGVPTKGKLTQPFRLYKEKTRFRRYTKLLQKDILDDDFTVDIAKEATNNFQTNFKALAVKLEESFLDYDLYQIAYVNDWPTINQALLKAIAVGASKITIFNMFIGSGFEYDLMLRELKKIDYSEIGITIEQTDFFNETEEIHDLLITKIANTIPSEKDLSTCGIILVCDGQPIEWDENYPYPEHIDAYVKSLTKKLVARGFKKDAVELAWLNYRSPDIKLCFENLTKKGYKNIIHVAATNPIDNLNSLYEIPTIMNKLAEKEDVDLIAVNGWNTEEEFVNAYLGLISNAKELPLVELGKDAKIALQASKVGASLTSTEEPEQLKQPEDES